MSGFRVVSKRREVSKSQISILVNAVREKGLFAVLVESTPKYTTIRNWELSQLASFYTLATDTKELHLFLEYA